MARRSTKTILTEDSFNSNGNAQFTPTDEVIVNDEQMNDEVKEDEPIKINNIINEKPIKSIKTVVENSVSHVVNNGYSDDEYYE